MATANDSTGKGHALTTGAVAAICDVAPRTVSKWIDKGLLPGWRIPGSKDRRVDAERLERFLIRHGIEGRIDVVRRVMHGENVHAVLAGLQGRESEWKLPVPIRGDVETIVDDSGYVYFAQLSRDGPILIGFSYDPARRISNLARCTPSKGKIWCLGVMLGGRLQERAMHRQFAALHRGGEWFRPGADLIQYINSHTISLEELADEAPPGTTPLPRPGEGAEGEE
jgi:hypothetical protein